MKRYLPLILPIGIFFLLKLTNIGIRLSDTNVYFYTAYQLLHGKILYRDITYTNFPLFPYISMLYFFLSGTKISLYFFIASLEAIVVSFLLWKIILKQYTNYFFASLTVILYLFSFIVLSTSDHETGVFTASVFAVLAYYLSLEKKHLWTGISIAASVLVKAYFAPVFLALFIWYGLEKRKDIVQFLFGSVIIALVVFLPTLFLARDAFIKDVISYSLTRTEGVSKANIVWFFIKHDFLLASLFLFSLVTIRKRIFLGSLSVFSLLFFLLYKVPYYLYLNFFIPFLCLSLPELLLMIQKWKVQQMIFPTIMAIVIIANLAVYLTGYRTLQTLFQVDTVVQSITRLHPTVLYGADDITPTLAYLSGVPLLNNIVDTNINFVNKGILNKTELTKQAISKHAIIISHGVYYPDYDINEPFFSGMIDKSLASKYCLLVTSVPVRTEGPDNLLNVFSCGK